MAVASTMILVISLILFLPILSSSAIVAEEEFSEELLLKPLPDRKVLAHFHFQTEAPPIHEDSFARHHHLFPKSISQLVKKFHVKAMELSFTQGRWNYERWGGFDPMSSQNAKPPGVELWAVFDVPPHQVDASWKNLTHSLSGLFCASINFLESSSSYSAPKWASQSALGSLRYGSLPREAVCTENLTPWLKLLPCRDKAGLSALMDRPSIYRSFYHSQRLHLTASKALADGLESGIILEQTLTVVLQPDIQRAGLSSPDEIKIQPSWSLSSIFGRKINGRCVLAKSSNVYLQVERDLVNQLENLQKNTAAYAANDTSIDVLRRNLVFEVSNTPDRVHRELEKSSSILYEYSIKEYNDAEQFDLSLTWKYPVVWSSSHAPLYASRFLMGSGNERGSIAISLKSTELTKDFIAVNNVEEKCKLQVNVLQIVPWYIKVYYHTLQLLVDEKPQAVTDFVEKMSVSPSEDKVSPGVMELVLRFPCDIKSAVLNIDFDKGFLHIDEYPPDANQGFDIPSAIISFPDFHAGLQFSNDSISKSPMLSKLQEKSPSLSYTEVLLVPLTTPDFSMPYNVITITCTVFALYFGSLLNVLRRRVGEEERLLKNKDANKVVFLRRILNKLRGRSSESTPPPQQSSSSSSFINPKLILKVLMVAGLTIEWQYYLK
ncbi:GPI transamidase component Gpi16 subunit-like protein [Medicago truncatula]|uniref:GPI transamidase component Gpi16 subunit-like protein n=2 Tax=Medicago truncatula TaxID=3880 RepID=A0A072TMW6_MEDTR|nr:GPI transamidase component Gpi16 subunit-like protein [Medicago truncatula]